MMEPLYPLLFNANLHETLWGGNRIRPLKGLAPDSANIGESWEVSAVHSSPSIVSNGHLAGIDLETLTSQYGAQLIGQRTNEKYEGRFPLLVKFIDARNDLSIQVHPDDRMAMERHNKMGKSEMWYIIDALPNSYIYVGFSKDISKEEYCQRVADGTICDVLARHHVRPGDVFYIPAGRVHAIGSGILLAEIQQSSDVTYRIYDYGRTDSNGRTRELHTDLAVEAIDRKVYPEYRTNYFLRTQLATRIVDTPFFCVNIVDVCDYFHRDLRKMDSVIIYTCLEGSCTITLRSDVCKKYQVPEDLRSVTLRSNQSCLIPASLANMNLTSHSHPSENNRLLESFIDNRDRNHWKFLGIFK